MSAPLTEKPCTHCGETKPVSEFYRRSNRLHGEYEAWCKRCKNRQAAHRARDRRRGVPADPRIDVALAKTRTSKRCACCSETLPLESFARDRQRADGRQAVCRTCASNKRKERYASNRAHELEQNDRYAKTNREALNQKERARNAANHDRVTQWRRAYIAANYKRVIETKRAWRKKNPHAIVAARHRRRAARKRVPSNLTANGIRAVFETFGNACAYCFRTDRKLTVDHVVPLTEGGHDTLDNIVPACGSCNSRKGARSILYMLNRCPSAALAA